MLLQCSTVPYCTGLVLPVLETVRVNIKEGDNSRQNTDPFGT